MILSLLFFLFVLLYYKKRFHTIINPVSIYCLGFILPIVSVIVADQFDLLRGFTADSAHTAIYYYNFCLICFLLPWIYEKYDNVHYKFSDHNYMQKTIFGLSCTLLFLLFLAILFLGGTPVIRMYLGEIDVMEYNILQRRLPLGVLAIITIFSYVLFLYVASFIANRRRYEIAKYKIVLLVIFCVALSLWQGKRQGLLLFIFVCFIRIIINKTQESKKRGNIINTKFIIVLFLFFLIFNAVSAFRTGNDTNNIELLQYSFYPVMNLASMIENNLMNNTIYPNNVLFEMLPNRFHTAESDIRSYLFEPTSPSGYFSYWFLDYGILGMALGAFILSLIAKCVYRKRFVSETNLRIYILMLWCCATACIYSHLLTNLFWLSVLFLYLFGNYVIKIKR